LRARELDSELAQAYSCLGRIALQECDLKRARAEFDNAFRLNPNLVEPLVWSARALSFLGMHHDAIARLKLARQLDPVSPRPYVAAAAVYYTAGDYRQSIDDCRAALELDPHLPTAFYYLGLSQYSAGQIDDAIESLQTCARESQRYPASLSALVIVLAHAGRRAEAQLILDEMKERATQAQVSPYSLPRLTSGWATRIARWSTFAGVTSSICQPSSLSASIRCSARCAATRRSNSCSRIFVQPLDESVRASAGRLEPRRRLTVRSGFHADLDAAAMLAGSDLHSLARATWADLGCGDGTFTLALADVIAARQRHTRDGSRSREPRLDSCAASWGDDLHASR
jgi:tetratricopeptide (TPR) repeat protein